MDLKEMREAIHTGREIKDADLLALVSIAEKAVAWETERLASLKAMPGWEHIPLTRATQDLRTALASAGLVKP